jgi:hypothetical protein
MPIGRPGLSQARESLSIPFASTLKSDVTVLLILGLLVVFLVLVWSAHVVDDYASLHYGYAPFALPNLLFMLIPHGLLLFAIRAGGEQIQMLIALAGAAMLGMLLLVRSRTNGWIALYAAPLLLLFAPVLALSFLFRDLARVGGGEGD